MAAPVFQNAGSLSAPQGTTDPTPGYPASIAAGDLLILTLIIHDNNPAVTTPTGWTQIYSTTGAVLNNYVIAKKADGTETGTLTVVIGNAANTIALAAISRFTGWNDTGTMTDAFEGGTVSNGASTTDAQASITTTGTDELVCALRGFSGAISASVDAYSGGTNTWTQAWEGQQTLGNSGTMSLDTTSQATAATVSGASDTITSTTWKNIVFAIKSSSVGTTLYPAGIARPSILVPIAK